MQVKGVYNTFVDLARGTITVMYNDEVVGVDELVKAIEKDGHVVKGTRQLR